jgi:hypothetical protein
MTERRPSSGSCARCRAALLLDAVQQDGAWYCSPACAEGRTELAPRPAAVPEPWLYARPTRFFRKRAPKELRRAPSSS